ncbi:hypothetical protein [Amycolatopsis taiwanensis]|uniref:hypothetical protein n=1 Tax=Amycolatopsis taiwanensis TaxID=342230 RepID=UPI00048251A8|nr:hypothetical protein [Amycolatopsis taiwanensis]
MTQPDHSARRSRPHGPKRRGDSTRLAGTRRDGDRRPYPTAPTTTRISPAKPGSATTRTRPRSSTETPTPATVWTAGATAIDLDASWPVPIVRRIVGAFSKPGARVVLLPWPTPGDHSRLGLVGADGVIERAPGADPDAEVADALDAVDGLDRSARVVRVAAETNLTGPASRPFWADLVGDPQRAPVADSAPLLPGLDPAVLDGPDAVPADTDLIITSLRPEHSGDHSSDLVALVAARLLRVGGILAVLTHSDWSQGELIDPTGAVVASAQNADLLYLQHIVALHAPVHGARFATELIPDINGSAAEQQARATHRATVRGLPAPHRRIHSDVLVFAQPHEYEPLPISTAGQAHTSEAIR